MAASCISFGGSEGPGCPTPTDPELAAAALATMPASLPPGDPINGASIYEQQCMRCHAPDPEQRGSRVFRKYPRLDCADWLDGVSDRYLAAAISVGGEALGKQKVMAAFGDTLRVAEIADLVAYLRHSVAGQRVQHDTGDR